MSLYLLPFYFPLLLGSVFPKAKGLLVFVGFFLILLIGFKSDVDKDYVNYEYLYNSVPSIMDGYSAFAASVKELNIEAGFLLLVSMLKAFELGLSAVFFVVGGISTGLLYYCSKKLNGNIFLIFAFLYSVSFIGLWVQIRYGLASVALLSAFILFSEKKYIIAILWVLVSMLFHGLGSIAFVVIAVFFCIDKIRLKKSQIAVLIAFVAVCLSLLEPRGVLVDAMGLLNDRYSDYAYDIEGSRLSFYARMVLFLVLVNLIQLGLVRDRMGVMLLTMVVLSLLAWSVAWSIGILYRVGTFLEMGYSLFLLRGYYASGRNYVLAVILLVVLSTWRIYIAVGELSNYQPFLPLFLFE